MPFDLLPLFAILCTCALHVFYNLKMMNPLARMQCHTSPQKVATTNTDKAWKPFTTHVHMEIRFERTLVKLLMQKWVYQKCTHYMFGCLIIGCCHKKKEPVNINTVYLPVFFASLERLCFVMVYDVIQSL
jgi:hypothetical protein